MSSVMNAPTFLKQCINNKFAGKEPWQIVSLTAATVLVSVWFWELLFQQESLHSRGKKYLFKMFRKIPYVSQTVNAELKKISDSFEKDVRERYSTVPFIHSLQEKGLSEDEIMTNLNTYLNLGDYNWKEGFVSGAVYYASEDLVTLLTKVYGLASHTNPLHADVFPGICKMEAEVVRISTNLFHGNNESCGTMTTGGTESIFMACKAYRDFAREEKGIRHPVMVIPRTAHPAFDKAAQYLCITIKYVSIDPVTTCVNLKDMKKSICRNTIMLVGSVPNYPYGTMDDIENIAALGLKYKIPVHVDCCLGGFLTAFMPFANFEIPHFDFKVPGVTSISADTHKFGYSPKGSSVILYSHPKYLHCQYCVTTDWPGGIYGSPTVNGSRAGGIIATCWATFMYFGMDGYVKATTKILKTAKYIEEGLRNMEGIYIFGKPITSVIAIGSNQFHIFRLAERLNEKGWSINPLQFPPGLHICITHVHTKPGVADRFIGDIEEALIDILKSPEKGVEGKMAMYGKSLSIPDRSIVGDFTKLFIDSMYYTPNTTKPDEIAPQNGTVITK